MSTFSVPTLAQMNASGEAPEVLFWVGCAGSFDDRAKKITKAMAKILHHSGVSLPLVQKKVVPEIQQNDQGMNFSQMQALMNIEVLNGYGVNHIVTTCPHCFNTFKNGILNWEEPTLEHHSQFLNNLLKQGRLKVEGGQFKGKKITFHDFCYLGRANAEYEAPRACFKN